MSRPGHQPRRGRALPTALLIAWSLVLGAGASGDARAATDESASTDMTREGDAIAFYTRLELMRARIHLGEELYRLGVDEDARAQLAAPATEHLPSLEAELRGRGLDRVVERIEGLAEAARESRSWLDVESLYEATRMTIQRARVEVDPSLREDPGFQVQVLLALARRALDEYATAVGEDDEITDDAAYHASYGFARQGRRLLDENEGGLGLDDRDLYDELVARYEQLLEAWPSARVPREGAVPVAEVRASLDAVTALVERY